MSNILEFDLNELVSKQVSEKINGLELHIQSQNKTIAEYRKEISDLKKVNKKFTSAVSLLEKLRERFSKVEGKPETNNEWKTTLRQQKYLFVKTILRDLFGLEPLTNNCLDVGFTLQLAVNYYEHKDILKQILDYISEDPSTEVGIINGFVMPYDWNKQQVLKWINGSKYNTNGCHKGISRYWLENGGRESNAPHDLILRNPHFLEDDVFEEMIKNMTSIKGIEHLLSLPQYANISQDRLERMGETLINLPASYFGYDEVKAFIRLYLKKFNEKTVEFLYKKARSDNHYNAFHWENFPQAYQEKFLLEKSFQEVFKIIGDYSCKWSEQQKRDFLKKYLERASFEPNTERNLP